MKRDYKQELMLFLECLAFPYVLIAEFKFHPTRKWRFDYAYKTPKIAIEYEGMPYRVAKSGHSTIKGYTSDLEKYNEACILGWKVLRFNAKMIENGLAFNQIEQLIQGTKQGGVRWLEKNQQEQL